MKPNRARSRAGTRKRLAVLRIARRGRFDVQKKWLGASRELDAPNGVMRGGGWPEAASPEHQRPDPAKTMRAHRFSDRWM
jgi:hypothetical protein